MSDEPDRTPRTRKALDAVAANRSNDPSRPWTHHDPLIAECVKLELDSAELLAALQALLNATMHKDHPMESDIAIAAIKRASQ